MGEQGGASRAEAAPSVQRNRESISVSGLYFSPFRHIQTVFPFRATARPSPTTCDLFITFRFCLATSWRRWNAVAAVVTHIGSFPLAAHDMSGDLLSANIAASTLPFTSSHPASFAELLARVPRRSWLYSRHHAKRTETVVRGKSRAWNARIASWYPLCPSLESWLERLGLRRQGRETRRGLSG